MFFKDETARLAAAAGAALIPICVMKMKKNSELVGRYVEDVSQNARREKSASSIKVLGL